MPFLMAKVTFDLGDVLYVFLDDVGICTCCKEVVTATPLATLVLRTFLALVLLASLALMSELPTRYVKREKINRFSLFRVLLFLFHRLVPLESLSVNLTGIGKRLLQRFYLYIDSFFDSLFSGV